MAKRIDVSGYEAFKACIQEIGEDVLINCYFTGNKDQEGISWCQKCAKVESFVMAAFESYAPKDSVFIYVQVGEKSDWMDLNNPFRKDKDTAVSVLPTIIRWKHPQRLQGSHLCSQPDVLQMFFTDELDE